MLDKPSFIVIYRDEIIDERTGKLIRAWFQSPCFLLKSRAEDFLKIVFKNPSANCENRLRWYGPVDQTYNAQIVEVMHDEKQNRLEDVKFSNNLELPRARQYNKRNKIQKVV